MKGKRLKLLHNKNNKRPNGAKDDRSVCCNRMIAKKKGKDETLSKTRNYRSFLKCRCFQFSQLNEWTKKLKMKKDFDSNSWNLATKWWKRGGIFVCVCCCCVCDRVEDWENRRSLAVSSSSSWLTQKSQSFAIDQSSINHNNTSPIPTTTTIYFKKSIEAEHFFEGFFTQEHFLFYWKELTRNDESNE